MAAMDGILRVPESTDIPEYLYELGLSDGFPLVPPTKSKLRWMLAATDRDPAEALGEVAPSLKKLTVQLAATNALMAGCTPQQLPLVLAAAEAMTHPDFNLHGVHATTMGASVCVIVNGPAREQAGINSGLGVLGSGTRANACVGRALKLILQNVGGAKLGGTESTTLGSPAKFTLCLAEKEESLGPWLPLANTLSSDHTVGESWVTVRAVSSGPEQLVDFDTRDAGDLIEKLASKAAGAWGAHFPMINETLVVISPEHAKTLQQGGYSSKALLQRALFDATNAGFAAVIHRLLYGAIQISALPTPLKPILGELVGMLGSFVSNLLNLLAPFRPRSWLSTLVSSALFYQILLLCGCSLPITRAAVLILSLGQAVLRPIARGVQAKLPKFSSPESFQIVVAGAEAGKFSSFLPGFGMGKPPMPVAHMSRAVTRRVQAPLETPAVPPAESSCLELVDPRCSATTTAVQRAARAPEVKGTVGLLDISKHGGSTLLDRIETRLKQRFTSIKCNRYCKPAFSRPCPEALRKTILSECDYVIEALAD